MTETLAVVGLLAAMWLSTRMPAYQPTMAERMIVMARDLAAFGNASARAGDAMLSTADAVDALRRALVGDVEPIHDLFDMAAEWFDTYDDEGNDE